MKYFGIDKKGCIYLHITYWSYSQVWALASVPYEDARTMLSLSVGWIDTELRSWLGEKNVMDRRNDSGHNIMVKGGGAVS